MKISSVPRFPPCSAGYRGAAADAAAAALGTRAAFAGGTPSAHLRASRCPREKRFGIKPTDLPFAFVLEPRPKSPKIVAVRNLPHDIPVRIAGPLAGLLGLIDGSYDGDALFFSRDLTVEGDVEAVVALRNAIDSEDVDFVADTATLLGPLAPLAGCCWATCNLDCGLPGPSRMLEPSHGVDLSGGNPRGAAYRRQCRRGRGLLRLCRRDQCAQFSGPEFQPSRYARRESITPTVAGRKCWLRSIRFRPREARCSGIRRSMTPLPPGLMR